jgi:hypothetical protein
MEAAGLTGRLRSVVKASWEAVERVREVAEDWRMRLGCWWPRGATPDCRFKADMDALLESEGMGGWEGWEE